jgi:hypothetical protein
MDGRVVKKVQGYGDFIARMFGRGNIRGLYDKIG